MTTKPRGGAEKPANRRHADTPPRLPEDEAKHRQQKALSLVKEHTMASLAPAAIPFPIIDWVALTGIQLRMLKGLTRIYELDFSKRAGRLAIRSLLTKMLAVSFMPALSSLVKVIPGIGQASGMAGTMITGSASTYAVGKLFIRHFEAGGSLANFDAKAMGQYIQVEFENGKKMAQELKGQSGKTA